MSSVLPRAIHYRGFTLPLGQLISLLLLLGLCVPLILATVAQSPYSTALLLVVISSLGLVLCRETQVRLNDVSLRILGYLWLVKLGVTFFLLYVGWIPQLDPTSSPAWGYDPQRYYLEAGELIYNNWIPDFVSLNYVGILYYYAAVYYLLGHNPVNPALINALVTLVATLYLVRVGYEIKVQRGPRDWTLALALLLPEILWFDVMTSRETLLGALLLFSMLPIGRYLARTTQLSLYGVLIVSGLSILAIAAVRTAMLLPVIASVALMMLFVKPQHGSPVTQRFILAIAAAVALAFGPLMAGYLGGYEFDLSGAYQAATSAADSVALSADAEWSENSIGMLLLPDGLIQAILFLPPRMVAYLLAPLPNILVPVGGLLGGSWSAWQSLFSLLSAGINMLAMPFVLASLVQSIKTRKENPAPVTLHIAFWVTFAAIAGGNLIIHERYRVMGTLLLWGCAWLGATTCTRALIIRTSFLWHGLLALGALFYFGYKFVF
jgi:hypothetical protein